MVQRVISRLDAKDVAREIKAHATAINTLDTLVSGLGAPELGALDGVTPGLVTLSKAVVVDANKDIGDFRNVDVVNLDAGASAVAGTVDIFPTTAASGKLAITCTDQTGDTTVTLTAGAMGQATAITIPDPGASSASVLLTAGAQTVTGVKTMSGANVITHAPTGLKVLDSNSSHSVTIAMGDESADRTLSVPVLGAADVVMTLGTAQTVAGVKTHSAKPIFSAGVNTQQAVNNVHDTVPTNAELETSFGGTAASLGRGFVGTIDDNDANAIGYIVWTSDASFYFVIGTKAT